MPFCEIVVPALTNAKTREHIARAVQEALGIAFGVPAGEKFQLVSDYLPGAFHFDRHQFGAERSDSVVIIRITAVAGRDQRQKEALYREIVIGITSHTDIRPDDVITFLVENDRADWSFNAGTPNLLETK